MIVQNAEGREVYINVFGDAEDPQIDEAYYVDSDDDMVTKDDLEYILYTYAVEIEEELMFQADEELEDYEIGA